MTQAVKHWNRTMKRAHLLPNSRFTEAIAATHGVYKRQNVRRQMPASGDRVLTRVSGVPKRMVMVDTTLSFAIKPVISAVEIRQSPNPRGRKAGAMNPAMEARMLSLESATRFR